jgi:hypothetical protein
MDTEEQVPLDPEQLAHVVQLLARQLATMKPSPKTEQLFVGEVAGVRTGALLVKRTYKPEGGRLVPAPDDEQSPICLGDVPCAELRPPRVSPLIAADESFAFKRMTDVVVQASAHAYAPNTTKTTVGLRFGKVEREIVVYGDRRGDFDRTGKPRFSDPAPFDSIPIRWDHAYGGFDVWAWKRRGIPGLDLLKPKPDSGLGYATPYHYPRNPCGSGFLLGLDEQTFTGLSIPNLEHPFAPLSPARMAVGEVDTWMRGPMPAAWDFQPLDWFPRCGYLGMTPPYKKENFPPAEITRGWAAEDLLATKPFLRVKNREEYRPELMQSAAPGLSVTFVAPNERFVLTNLHPRMPTHTIDLPGEVPHVVIELEPGKLTEVEARIVTVVLRVDLDEVECLWCARFPLPPALTEDELLDARRVVQWKRPGQKG